jgi:tetratricopeptide (TPR) repeat protein
MPSSPPARLRPAWVLALTALAACAVYANALGNGYALDDVFILRDNPVVHGLGDLRALLLGAWWPGTDELYRPVALASFAVEWALLGEAPALFHATNVLLHAGAAVLAAALVLRLGGGRAAALGAGLLFAVHPVHVEAVANLVGRAEVLATLGVLGACHLYLARRIGAAGRAAGIAVLYLLALGAKESAVALPALLLVVDALRTREEGLGSVRLLRRNAVLLGVLTVCLAGYMVLRQQVLGGLGNDPAPYLRGLSTADRLATAVRLWPEYVRLMLFPRDLSAEWGPDALRPATWAEPMVWLGLLLGMGLAFAAWRSWKAGRWIAAAVLWFAFAVLPVSQILFPVGVLLAERTLYLPSVALVFLLPPLVAAVERRAEWVRPAALAGGVALALLAARTWTRTPSWESTNTVFSQMVEDHPDLWFVEWQAGELLVRAGRSGEALPWYRKALEKVNRNHPGMNVSYASILLDLGRVDEAEPLLRRTLAIQPRLAPARMHLASVLVQRGRYREALELLDSASLAAADTATRDRMEHRRALAYDGLGQADSALAVREAALRAARGGATGPAWFHYARLLALHGRMDEARAAADSARARLAPAYRARVTVQPVPRLDEPLLRGWGRLAEQSAPAAPTRPASPVRAPAPVRGGR